MATDLQIAARRIVSLNPATGEVLREIDCAGEVEVRTAVQRARAAQPAWAERGLRRRIEVLRKFQTGLYARKSEIAAGITRAGGQAGGEGPPTERIGGLFGAPVFLRKAWGFFWG